MLCREWAGWVGFYAGPREPRRSFGAATRAGPWAAPGHSLPGGGQYVGLAGNSRPLKRRPGDLPGLVSAERHCAPRTKEVCMPETRPRNLLWVDSDCKDTGA